MRIRPEDPSDVAAVRAVNEAAFDSPLEADIIEKVRAASGPLLSLVAEVKGEIVGHILFTPVTLRENHSVQLMGLGPMAVVPARQNQGIGSELVREGLAQCKHLGCSAVVVLGHPNYYSRFGFAPASGYGITSEYDVPDEVFMLYEIQPGSLQGVSGQVIYSDAFAGA
jgi:putative acetyltransferase